MAEAQKKILIVEDDKSLSRIIGEVLKKEGYDVSFAYDGEKGLAMALETAPDLMLLDIQLPRMDGKQLLEKLREQKNGSSIPVIVLSNMDDVETVSKMLEGNVKIYFVKANLNLSDLIAQIKKMLPGTY